MPDPLHVEARVLTPEEEATARAGPLRTVRAKEPGAPLTPEAVTRARWRGMLVGASLAAGAAVAAFVGLRWWGRRRSPRPARGTSDA